VGILALEFSSIEFAMATFLESAWKAIDVPPPNWA